MMLPKFDFHEPDTIEGACEIVSELGNDAKALAGGTDLLVGMKRKVLAPGHLVSLSRIGDLKKVASSNGEVSLGACLTAAELGESEEVRGLFRALGKGAAALGSPLIRNLATLGGNLVWARPAADLPPPLLAYGAKVRLKKKGEERTVELTDFFKGPGETVIGPDEILTAVVLNPPPEGAGAGYVKLGLRKALEISLVNVAAYIHLDEKTGVIQTARVALGAVAPLPMRAGSAEAVLKGEKPSEELFARAGEAAAGDSKPIDDFRGSAEYRRAMVSVLTRRALLEALEEAQRR